MSWPSIIKRSKAKKRGGRVKCLRRNGLNGFWKFGPDHRLFYYGGLGKRAQRIATWLLERNAVHVIASDAHDDKHRKPILSEARDAVSRSFGADFAQALVLENPAAIIAGHPLPSSRRPSRDTSQKFLGKIG